MTKPRKQKYTTKAQDKAFIAGIIASQTTAWKPGDKCMTYDLSTVTTVASIEGDTVTTTDAGRYNAVKSFHISKLRLPR